ncbi:MAG TPA: formate dehydrogenase subunit gamma [Magnetovibrio sp.]
MKTAFAQADNPLAGSVPGEVKGSNSNSDLWRGINHGEPGTVSIPDQKAATLINRTGEDWRLVRMGPLPMWGGVLMGISLVGVLGFALVYGKFKLHGERTGRVIPRFSQAERWVHWFVASLFIMLGLTGIVILLGRFLLKPVFGADVLGALANASLQAHNLLGPIFIVAMLIMLVMYFKDNFYQKGDFTWALKGGFFSKHHPPSWKYNLGEKSWYWLIAFAGTALSLSGVFLIFPTLLDDVQGMQLSHIVHAICAVVLIAASLGHIYLGIWGVEGALDSMTLGYVDETWGLEHHRWWAEEEIKKERVVEGAPDAVLAAKHDQAT